MRKTATAMITATLVLGGCATVRDSRLNPMNWFGGAQETVTVAAADDNTLIPRGSELRDTTVYYRGSPVDRVTQLAVDRMPGGAIIRVQGVAARQGPFDVRLRRQPTNDPSVLSYILIAQQRADTPVGTEASRRVTVAASVTDQQLARVREIRVSGGRNTLTTRR